MEEQGRFGRRLPYALPTTINKVDKKYLVKTTHHFLQGLPVSKLSEWFSQIPVCKVPQKGSDVEKYREMQLLHQATIELIILYL